MGNSLYKNLSDGDCVVIGDRVFVCNGTGFGSFSFTNGSTVGGCFEDRLDCLTKINGNQIDREKTIEKYSEFNGWIHRFTGFLE